MHEVIHLKIKAIGDCEDEVQMFAVAHWLHLPKVLVTISLKKDMNNLEKNQ
jgi:hypothetical protein